MRDENKKLAQLANIEKANNAKDKSNNQKH